MRVFPGLAISAVLALALLPVPATRNSTLPVSETSFAPALAGDDGIAASAPDHAIASGLGLLLRQQVLTWGLDRIDARPEPGAPRGSGVKVAVLDTGIDLRHPDLRVSGNASFVPGALDGNDDNGHGTMVAGIIAAQDNGIGISGVASGVSLYAVKVLDKEGVGSVDSVVAGINWAVGEGVQVINMSFGVMDRMPRPLVESLEKAYRRGIVLVAAAGGLAGVWAPARYGPVIAVGAVDQADTRAPFSSTGRELELTAPGYAVLSTYAGGDYRRGSGTSFAAPFVSGVAALLISAGTEDSSHIRAILARSAEDLGPAGRDPEYGYGLVNARRALAAAR